MILVSVIVPVYNVEGYVRQCIDSIVVQTYHNIEVVCVDDGSTDGSSIILDEFALKDSRIRVLHKENGGLVSARKEGVKLATGDYIVHVDGDDYISETRIENLVRNIKSEKADIIIMAGENRVIRRKCQLREPVIAYRSYQREEICGDLFPQFVDEEAILNLNWGMWSVAVRSDIAKKCQSQLDDRITYLEDFACLMLFLQNAQNVSVVRECGYYYIYRENSITKQYDSTAVEKLQIMWEFVKNHMRTDWWICIAPHLRRYCVGQLLYKAYGEFLAEKYNYLYPFPDVLEGEKIVIYGSGLFGAGMVAFLKNNKKFILRAWIDENIEHQPIEEVRVQHISAIQGVEYDHIVIALMREKSIQKVKSLLIDEGAKQEKIASVDRSLYEKEYLPKGLFL